LKILFVLHYPPPVHGAAVVGDIIRKSHLINSSFECRYVNLGISKNIDDIGRNKFSKVYKYIAINLEVLKNLVLFRPDICYVTPVSNGIGFYKDAVVIFWIKIFRRKVIYHFHNKGITLRQDKAFDNLLYKLVFHNAYVILLSKLLYPDVKKYVPEKRIFYCPNGIPENMSIRGIKPEIIEYADAAAGRKIHILFLSNLIRSKGIFTLLDACRILKERQVSFECLIAGGQGDLTLIDIQQFVEKNGLNSCIKILGPIHDQGKVELLSASDIMVHPTLNDCLPLVLLEAMQHSLPVISTNEGAIPDVVLDGVTGFLVQKNDAVTLADKIELLIKDSYLRIRMGESGYYKFRKEFTIEIFEKNLAHILQDMIKKRN
jgi:glycosyltransferase involved in cell wall biosynthesis